MQGQWSFLVSCNRPDLHLSSDVHRMLWARWCTCYNNECSVSEAHEPQQQSFKLEAQYEGQLIQRWCCSSPDTRAWHRTCFAYTWVWSNIDEDNSKKPNKSILISQRTWRCRITETEQLKTWWCFSTALCVCVCVYFYTYIYIVEKCMWLFTSHSFTSYCHVLTSNHPPQPSPSLSLL